jgi:hypothetical protein
MSRKACDVGLDQLLRSGTGDWHLWGGPINLKQSPIWAATYCTYSAVGDALLTAATINNDLPIEDRKQILWQFVRLRRDHISRVGEHCSRFKQPKLFSTISRRHAQPWKYKQFWILEARDRMPPIQLRRLWIWSQRKIKCSDFQSQHLKLLPKTLRDMECYVLDWMIW